MSIQDQRKFKVARKKLELTQKQVADKIGITPNHYAKIERGEEPPSDTTREAILKVLKIKLEYKF